MSITNALSISQARKALPTLVDDAATKAKTTYITVKGQVKAAIISAAELESLNDTLEILSDPETMSTIREAEADIKAGHTIPLKEVKKMLKLE